MTDLGLKTSSGKNCNQLLPACIWFNDYRICTKVCQLRRDNGGITEQILLQGYCKGIAKVLHEPVMNP